MKALEDLEALNEEQVKKHIATDYADVHTHKKYDEADATLLQELKKYKILIAYESVGSWGCDSSSFFLIRDKKTKELFEVHGGHCSCYGFEGQWTPETTSIEYLKSKKFNFSTGGYDDNDQINKKEVADYLKRLK